jgi:hypothetical protein
VIQDAGKRVAPGAVGKLAGDASNVLLHGRIDPFARLLAAAPVVDTAERQELGDDRVRSDSASLALLCALNERAHVVGELRRQSRLSRHPRKARDGVG